MRPDARGTIVFGVTLKAMPAPAVLGSGDERFLALQSEALTAGYAARRGSLLRALLAMADSGLTLDFRLIATPDPGRPSRGTVVVALLVRLDDVEPDAAARSARALHEVLRTAFPESDWGVQVGRDIPAILRPFDINHIVRITRRTHLIGSGSPVDREADRAITGFVTPAAGPIDGSDPGVVFVAPFTPAVGQMDALCRLLFVGQSPLALSVRLRRVAVRDIDREELDATIVRARTLSAWAASRAQDGPSWSMLRDLTEAAALHLADRRVSLEAGALAVSIELVSPDAIPPTVVAATADLFTAPLGWHGDSPAGPLRLLSGGHTVTCPIDMPAARAAFQLLDLCDSGGVTASRDWFSLREAEGLVVLPPTPAPAFPGIMVRSWRRVPAPAHTAPCGALIGVSDDWGVEREVRLSWHDRLRHQHVVGQTGTGKSTFLLHQILADIEAGHGVALLDPHGDLLQDVLDRIPAEREEDVVLIDPADEDRPVAINPLAVRSADTAHRVVEGMLSAIQRIVTDRHGPGARDWMGPIFEQHVRMNLLLLMSDPNRPASLYDFYQLYQIPDHYKEWLPLRSDDPLLKSWVETVLPQTDYQRQGSESVSMGGYIGSKFQQFAFDPRLRRLFSQRTSTVDFADVLARRRILLVNLSKGELGESNAEFTGMVILVMLLAAVFERARDARADRTPFFVHIDEFQNMLTGALVPLLSEGRKYGIGLTLAHQYVGQVDQRIMDAVLGNVGTHVSFRVGLRDAERIEGRFLPTFSARDITNLPNYHMCVAGTFEGNAAHAFSARTLPPPPPLPGNVRERVRGCSRGKYGMK